MERRDLEIRLAAAMSGANTASPNSDNENKALDTALVNQKALAEAVRQARESIERDHEVKVYRMEREHEEALEALQDQLDRAEADRSGVSSERDSKQVAVLEAEIARLERALQDASDSHSNTSGEKNTVLADDLAQLRGQKEEAERLAGQRLQIINDLEVDIGRFHGERATNARQLDSLKEAAEAVEGEVVQPLRTEVATLETAVKRLEGEKAAAERQSQQDAEGFEHEIAQSEEERERAEFLLQEAQVERKNLAEEVQVLQQSIAELETESSQQAERIAELEQELAAARDQLDSSLVTASSSRTSLEAQLSSLQEALELANVTKSSIHSRLVAVEAEVKTLSTRNEVLVREASDSDMKRLKLQKANEVLYAEFEKMGIALETKQLEVEMLKRKVKKPDVLGEGHKDGTATAVEALKARHARDTLAAVDREAEDSHTAEVLLEKGPNPLRARGRKTIDPWAQQQVALASRDSDTDNGRTPTAATSRAGTTISSSRAATKASESHQSEEISARRLSSRTATDKPRSVLGPSSVGNTSHSRTSRVSRASKYSVDLSETEDASKSQIRETSRATGSAIGGATATAAVARRGSSSSLSSNLTTASSTSSRSKHSVHDPRSLTGATMPMEMRRESGASISSQQSASQSATQSRDEPMSLDELRTELGTSTSASASVDRSASASANASGTGTARLRGSYSSSSSLLKSRSLATRSISVSQPSYSQSRPRQRQGHGSDAGSELMDLVESDADADADAELELELEGHTDENEEEEEA
ncbi:hypothetical protein BCV69DRAFT_82754 [Microstroma glucosiphilum]|uniref:Uncharacterized protein n=1 Tax=Pseudomicrostroma glucosiphilum TaxID=1684307 RepID=A0A316TZC5_9BASI|nr:hypothetical protein BCV69DRAFT_82754 [Pseudomicrostroma glucosiphilum]PWN18340.1 hypothetical protein BCV69DRAFT_82754 [Pseudomicrostroma glucosiphilum]